MKFDRSQLSETQFMFVVACFIQASSLLTSFIAGLTLQDSWIVILFAGIACALILWVYRSLIIMYPDRNLLQILEELYGKILGKCIGALYVWFFITLASLNLMDFAEFVKRTIMIETPIMVLLVLSIAVCAYAVRNGIQVVAHYSTLFSVIAIVFLITSMFFVLNQMDFTNFLPIMQMPVKKYIQGTHLVSTIPFGELVVMLMLMPNLKINRQNITKFLYWGLFIGVLTLLLVIIRDVAVLGNTMKMFTMPSLITLQLVNLGQALSRMEILFYIILIILLFYKVGFLYYISAISVAQLTNSSNYKHFVFSIGALILIYGTTLFDSPIEHIKSAQNIVPIGWTLFEYILPLLTFILAKIKQRRKKAEVVK